jgi:3-oxoacyl-[acyl-carrier protein] reductase
MEAAELHGKVALVTGAGRGIGREISLALARQGAAVVASDLGGGSHGGGRDATPAQAVADEIVSAGGAAVADGGDVTVAADADAMVQRAVDEFGQLDIVVNCAGILGDKMVFTMPDEVWDVVVRVHLYGHFHVTRAACRHFRERAKRDGGGVDGRVICMSSEAGIYGNVGQVNYAGAKAGIVALAFSVAREMKRYGVTSNAIAPRARTRLTEGAFGEIAGGEGIDTWDPAHVAPLVTFLATPAGGAYTGQLFVAGGGVYQVLAQPSVAAEVRIDRAFSHEDVGAFVADALGPSADVVEFPDLGIAGVGAHG